MSNFPLPGGVMVRTWEIVLPGGHIKNLTDKYIFQYSEHHKSENFPQLWWDTHIRVKKILEIKPRAVWNYRSLILYGQSQTIVVSYPSFLMLTLTWGIKIFFGELTPPIMGRVYFEKHPMNSMPQEFNKTINDSC